MDINLGVALDYLGVGFFAVSGAIAAAERRQDFITFLFFGGITGIGGGTLRDLLIGAPVFWVRQPNYLTVCAVAALLVWFWRGWMASARALLWMDAVGLSAYAVVGSAKALGAGLSPPVCVAMGVLTACFGGVLRDVVAGQPSVLLRREIYLTAAMLAGAVFVGAQMLGAPTLAAGALGMLAGFGLRGGALLRGWQMPGFKPQRVDY